MLSYRIASGLLLIAASFLVFWLDSRTDSTATAAFWRDWPPGVPILLGMLLLVPLAASELHTVFRARNIETSTLLISTMTALTLLAIYLSPRRDSGTAVAIVSTALIGSLLAALTWHARGARVEGAVAAGAATLLGVAYLGLLGAFYLAIRRDHSAWVVLAVLLVTKACDIGAYAAGKTVGRRKLIPWLSPGKTWEGLVGGVALSVALALAFAWLGHRFPLLTVVRTAQGLEPRDYRTLSVAGAGAAIALTGVMGGMLMSLFKRDAGIKDSGSIIPGMGGVLDVLDSPLLVAPVAYWVLRSM